MAEPAWRVPRSGWRGPRLFASEWSAALRALRNRAQAGAAEQTAPADVGESGGERYFLTSANACSILVWAAAAASWGDLFDTTTSWSISA
jgi:hypothetical protein